MFFRRILCKNTLISELITMLTLDFSSFGKKLREQRRAHHLTQEQLAELVDVSFQFIGMLERGKKTPSVQTLLSLCAVLGCSCETLFEDSLPEEGPLTLRQRPPVLRNTLSNWVLASEPDESLTPPASVDLQLLPPLGFSAIDETA